MTPLELLAVGVIVVLVWLAGFAAGDSNAKGRAMADDPIAEVPLLVGLLAIVLSLTRLLFLGIKEAAK